MFSYVVLGKVFHLVKLLYNSNLSLTSHVLLGHFIEFHSMYLTFIDILAKGKGSGGVKTAKLYAWVALQSLPEEMVISPCLLDFLEKALETIPITPIERNYTGKYSPYVRSNFRFCFVKFLSYITCCYIFHYKINYKLQ